MNTQMLELDKIRIDGDTQPRVAIDGFVVRQYAADMERGVEFPPIQVMFDGATYWLVDGFHRYHAHKNLAKLQIAADVATGVQAEAQWQSLTANKTHGLRRTNEDKVKAVLKALKLRPGVTDHVIADHVGVTHVTVAKYRLSIENDRKDREERSNPTTASVGKDYQLVPGSGGGANCQARRIGKDGKKYPVNRRRAKAGPPRISQHAAPVVRGLSKPLEKKTFVEMPLDPEAGAFALVSLLERSYIEQLVIKLTAILEGRGGTPPALRDLPVSSGVPQ